MTMAVCISATETSVDRIVVQIYARVRALRALGLTVPTVCISKGMPG